MPTFTVRKTSVVPEFSGLWDGPVWNRSDTLSVNQFHPASSNHRPEVAARLLYDREGIYVHFKIKDRYVRSVHTHHQESVCQDSCAEFFFQPKATPGYLNMEANAGGVFLCSYITDHQRVPGGFAKYRPIDSTWLDRIKVYHSLPAIVDPELTEPVEWHLEYCIPFTLIEAYTGPLGRIAGQVWSANFYKCGDQTSHPHWASWAPIGEELNFHKPDRFAPITFEP